MYRDKTLDMLWKVFNYDAKAKFIVSISQTLIARIPPYSKVAIKEALLSVYTYRLQSWLNINLYGIIVISQAVSYIDRQIKNQ